MHAEKIRSAPPEPHPLATSPIQSARDVEFRNVGGACIFECMVGRRNRCAPLDTLFHYSSVTHEYDCFALAEHIKCEKTMVLYSVRCGAIRTRSIVDTTFFCSIRL